MAEENRGPLDPAQPAPAPPEAGGQANAHGNGATSPPHPDPTPGTSAEARLAAGAPLTPPAAEQIAAGRPPEGRDERIRAGNAPLPGHGQAAATAVGHPSEALLILRWWLGLMLILAAGWGFIAVVVFMAKNWNIHLAPSVVGVASSILSLCLFLFLEQDLWLSRFMGLRLGPNSSPLKEALFFWLTGVIGLLLRSTASPESPPAPAPALSTGTGDKPAPLEVKDGFREIVETIVFVVVLVLMLKSFLAEAFVIPTGSMATTLLGYHQNVECPACGYKFRINMSVQLDSAQQHRAEVTGCTCQNCQLPFNLPLGPREGGPP